MMAGQMMVGQTIGFEKQARPVNPSLQGTADVVANQLATINARLSNFLDTLRGNETDGEPTCDAKDRSEAPMVQSIHQSAERVLFANKQLDELQSLLFGW